MAASASAASDPAALHALVQQERQRISELNAACQQEQRKVCDEKTGARDDIPAENIAVFCISRATGRQIERNAAHTRIQHLAAVRDCQNAD
jgi:hypothetical protein